MFSLAFDFFVRNVGSEFFKSNNEVAPGLINELPDELVAKIFSDLNCVTRKALCCVSKKWVELAYDENTWKKNDIYEKAITIKKWASWFGKEAIKNEDLEEEWNSLPSNIAEIFESPCPIFPQKKISDTHVLVRIPKTLNGEFCLNRLIDLVSKNPPKNNKSYEVVCLVDFDREVFDFVDKSTNQMVEKSYWILMTKYLLPKSRHISYSEQQTIIDELNEKPCLFRYTIPKTIECAASILFHYYDRKEYLLSNGNFPVFTRCEERINDCQVIVGHTSESSLRIQDHDFDGHDLGIAVVCRLVNS